MKKGFILIFLCFVVSLLSCVSNDNSKTATIAVFSLDDMSVLQSSEFSEIFVSNTNKHKVKELLLASIDVAENNIFNETTTETADGSPYRQIYVQVYKDFSYEIKYVDKVKWVYDPSHPSACVSGEKKGFVAYPDIDIQQQKADILKIRDFLHDIDV